MDKYRSYLWREVSNDNIWRIQTPDPEIKEIKQTQVRKFSWRVF